MKNLWKTMLAVCEHENVPSPMADLTRSTGLDPSMVAESLVVLQRVGAVELFDLPDADSPRFALRITKRGHALCDAIHQFGVDRLPDAPIHLDRARFTKLLLENDFMSAVSLLARQDPTPGT